MIRAVVLTCGLSGLCLISLLLGARGIADPSGVMALFGPVPPDNVDAIVITQFRLPRTLAALLAGACLGIAGAVIQALSRNPLAEPGLLGVNAGSAFAIVLAVWVFGPLSAEARILPALAGALAAASLIWALAGRTAYPLTLILAGVALTAVLGAGVRGLILIDSFALDSFRRWAVGSVASVDRDALQLAAGIGLVGAALAVPAARGLDALALGDDLARTLGTSLGRTRRLALATTALLSTAAVLVAGPLIFVGLIAPHIARVTGAQTTLRLIAEAGLWGAALVLVADLIGRTLFAGVLIEAGLGVALVGGPLLIWLVRQQARDAA